MAFIQCVRRALWGMLFAAVLVCEWLAPEPSTGNR